MTRLFNKWAGKMELWEQPTQCDLCHSENILLTTKYEATGRRNDAWPYIWFCNNCGAYVGCHVGTYSPLGHLAHDRRRFMRKQAHDVMDQIWLNGLMSRDRCYQWIGEQLGEPDPIHIGMLTTSQLHKVIQICREYLQLKAKKIEKERRKHHESKRRERRRNHIQSVIRRKG
ncbi:MAG: zinc-finger-containing protein [Minisyncoccia bacterium]